MDVVRSSRGEGREKRGREGKGKKKKIPLVRDASRSGTVYVLA